MIASFSACTATGSPSCAARSIPSKSVWSSARSKSSMPVLHMKALNPMTPRPASSSSRSRLPGTRPPQRQKSTRATPRAAATLRSNEAPSIVGGEAFRGMSKKQVPPPAAKAAVPVANPSQSVRPGSLQMHVRIDNAREDMQSGRVELGPCASHELRPDRGDPAVEDPDVGPCNTVRPHHPGSAYENVEGAHCRRRGYRQPDVATRTETCRRPRR